MTGRTIRSGPQAARGLLRTLSFALSLVFLHAAPAAAHLVTPNATAIPIGGTDYIYVADVFTCQATITATVADTGVAKIYEVNMATGQKVPGAGKTVTVPNRIDQVFLIEASTAMVLSSSTSVTVCWTGVDWPGPGACVEQNCPTGVQVPIIVSDFPQTHAHNAGAELVRDPINTATGEVILPEQARIALGGPSELTFATYYASRLSLEGNVAGRMGPNWSHNYDWALTFPGNQLEVVTPKGRVIRFEKGFFDTTWTLSGTTDLSFQLVESGPDYVLGNPNDGNLYTFDSNGRLTTIEDGPGNQITFTYDGFGRLSTASDGLGRTLTYTYDGASRLVNVTDGTRNTSMTYDGFGRLSTLTDAGSGVTTYTYDAGDPGAALLASWMLPRGNTPYTHTFDGNGRAITQTDALGKTFTLSYDDSTGRTTVTGPDLAMYEHLYDSLNQFVEYVDQNSGTMTISYDSNGRRVSVVDQVSDVTSWTYDPASGYVSSFTDADAGNATFGYTPRVKSGITFYDLTSVQWADGANESYTYDASGNLTSHTDPESNTWTYTHNARGQVLTATNPKGGVTTYTYNADGTTATETDPSTNTTVYGYDALRRLDQITFADLTSLTATYDAMNGILSVNDEESNTWGFGYDANGNLTSRTTPLGHVWGFAYDDVDRVTTLTNPFTNTTTYAYDGYDRLVDRVDGNANADQLGYDSRGHLTSLTDPGAKVWSQTVDAEGFTTSLTNPLSKTTTLTSDVLGMYTTITTPLSNQVVVGHDALGRVTSVVDPLGGTATLVRDDVGMVTQADLQLAGVSANFARDGLGELTSITGPRAGVWGRTVDNHGRVTAEQDPVGNVRSYTYNSRNLPATLTFPGGLGSVTFTYDGRNLLTRRQYTDGTDQMFVYDDDARLTSAEGVSLVWDDAERVIDCNGITMTYDAGSRLSTVTYAPGKVVTYTYDSRDNLLTVTDWVGGVTTFVHDDASRLTSVSRPNGITTTYTYDDEDRIASIAETGLSTITLTRDAASRITEAVRNVPLQGTPSPASLAFAYDLADQVSTFTYDALGRMTNDGTHTCTWDLASRLTSLNDGGGPVTFDHDVEGNVIARTEGGTTREYVWNHTLILPSIQIVRENAADLRYYVLSPGGVVLHSVEASDNARRFYHADEVGSTIFLTNDAGAVTDSYLYSPFGRLLAETGTTDNPFTFHGTYGVLREGDLYHMRARVYDASTGRFLSRDPLVVLEPRTANFYQAFFNSPLTYVDPEGTRIAVSVDESGRRTFRDDWKGAALFEIYDREFQRLLESVKDQPPDVRRRTLQPRVEEWLRIERERIRARARAVAEAGGRDVMRNQRDLRDCALLIRKFRSLVYAPVRARAIIDPESVRRSEASTGQVHFSPLPFYTTGNERPPLTPRPEDMLRCVHPR